MEKYLWAIVAIPFCVYGLILWIYGAKLALKALLVTGGCSCAAIAWMLAHPLSPVLYILAGGLTFGTPLRVALSKKELDALKKVEIGKYEALRTQLAEQFFKVKADLKAKQEALTKDQAKVTKKLEELEARHDEVMMIRDDYLLKKENLESREKRLDLKFDAYNEAVSDYHGALQQQADQLKILKDSNERLKGALGRLTPYRDAWKQMFRAQSPETQDCFRQILKDAQQAAKTKPNAGSKHPPRAPISMPLPLRGSYVAE